MKCVKLFRFPIKCDPKIYHIHKRSDNEALDLFQICPLVIDASLRAMERTGQSAFRKISKEVEKLVLSAAMFCNTIK